MKISNRQYKLDPVGTNHAKEGSSRSGQNRDRSPRNIHGSHSDLLAIIEQISQPFPRKIRMTNNLKAIALVQ
jgi:hypothetical protein